MILSLLIHGKGVEMDTAQSFRAAIIGTGRIADLYDDETVHIPDITLPPGNVHANMYNIKPVSHAGACRESPSTIQSHVSSTETYGPRWLDREIGAILCYGGEH